MVTFCISASVLIYFYIGNPDYADQPYTQVKNQEQALNKLPVNKLIILYEEKLKKNDTLDARLNLANMLARLGRLEQAEKHFKAAYNMDKGVNPDITFGYIEIMIARNKGIISQKSYNLINDILDKQKSNPKGLFFKGLFFAQNNNIKQAIDIWKNLVIESKDKPYYGVLVQNLNAVIGQFNINPVTIGLNTTQDIIQDNLPMIEKMVQSLADKVKQNPNDEKLKERLKEVQEKLDIIKTF